MGLGRRQGDIWPRELRLMGTLVWPSVVSSALVVPGETWDSDAASMMRPCTWRCHDVRLPKPRA